MEIISYLVTHYGYLAIFILLMVGIFGIPIPDELLLTFAGFLAYRGELHLALAILAASSGCIVGLSVNYTAGRVVGVNLIGKCRFISTSRFKRFNGLMEQFNRWGGWVLFFGYFLPGVRHWVSVGAGIAKFPTAPFALFAYSGSLVWSVLYISLGYFLGKEEIIFSEQICTHLRITAGAMALLFAGYFLIRERLRSRRSATPIKILG
jgi:membrane protein DedA with SNARE-associated domain